MTQYRAKSVVVDAMQFQPLDSWLCPEDIRVFLGAAYLGLERRGWGENATNLLKVKNPSGVMMASSGDWVVKTGVVYTVYQPMAFVDAFEEKKGKA